MANQDQDRPQGAGESGPGTETDSGSEARNSGGQSAVTAVKGAADGLQGGAARCAANRGRRVLGRDHAGGH
jgi:hypothetical protein